MSVPSKVLSAMLVLLVQPSLVELKLPLEKRLPNGSITTNGRMATS